MNVDYCHCRLSQITKIKIQIQKTVMRESHSSKGHGYHLQLVKRVAISTDYGLTWSCEAISFGHPQGWMQNLYTVNMRIQNSTITFVMIGLKATVLGRFKQICAGQKMETFSYHQHSKEEKKSQYDGNWCQCFEFHPRFPRTLTYDIWLWSLILVCLRLRHKDFNFTSFIQSFLQSNLLTEDSG